LGRAPEEPLNRELQRFYERLLAALRRPEVRDGKWQLLSCAPAWDGNWTNDCFVASGWEGTDGAKLVVAVNYAPNQSQCRLQIPFANLRNRSWHLQDQLSSTTYERDGKELESAGLFLDQQPWQAAVFSMT